MSYLALESSEDGNGFYNLQAMWLLHAYRQGEWNVLLADPVFVKNIGKILTFISHQQQDEELKKLLIVPLSSEHIGSAMEHLIQNIDKKVPILSGEKKVEEINWEKLQQAIAQALRALVAYSLKTRTNLAAIVERTLKSIALKQGGLQALYEGMPQIDEINEKIDPLQWWFNGEKTGLHLYLQGLKGVHGSLIEMYVLSTLLHYVIKYYPNGFSEAPLTIYTFEDESNAQPENKLICEIERKDQCLNLLLNNDKEAQQIIQNYQSENQSCRKRKLLKGIIDFTQILKEYGSYLAHHQKEFIDYSDEEYIKFHGLTRTQYQQNILPEQDYLEKQPALVQLKKVDSPFHLKKKPLEYHITQMNKEFDWLNYMMVVLTVMGIWMAIISYTVWPWLIPLMNFLFVDTLLAGSTYPLTIAMTTMFGFTLGIIVSEKLHFSNKKETVVEKNCEIQTMTNVPELSQSASFLSKYLSTTKVEAPIQAVPTSCKKCLK